MMMIDENWLEKLKYSEETHPKATVSTRNPRGRDYTSHKNNKK
jgi:hypothetical protein